MRMQAEVGATTLIDSLVRHAHERGSKIAYRVLTDGEHEDAFVTFEQLSASARRVATEIQARRLTGQPLLILCPTGVEYVIAIFGCWLGRAIAVPAYPPTRSTVGRVTPRIEAIIADSGARAALVTADVRALLQSSPTDALSAVGDD
jgi:acyl-CoA synthetase (AMP-forming)/AMP-acid ligase II